MDKQKQRLKTNKNKRFSFRIFTGNKEIDNLIKVYLLVIVVFFVFWALTVFLTQKDSEEKPEEEKTEIQYKNIMVGNILNMPESTYYILVKKPKDQKNSLYETYFGYIAEKENAVKQYIVDLENMFNQPFLSEQSNLLVEKISDIKFKNTTLLKVENHKIVLALEEDSTIEAHLKELMK